MLIYFSYYIVFACKWRWLSVSVAFMTCFEQLTHFPCVLSIFLFCVLYVFDRPVSMQLHLLILVIHSFTCIYLHLSNSLNIAGSIYLMITMKCLYICNHYMIFIILVIIIFISNTKYIKQLMKHGFS